MSGTACRSVVYDMDDPAHRAYCLPCRSAYYGQSHKWVEWLWMIPGPAFSIFAFLMLWHRLFG